jgi:hypothetical protein
MYVGRCPHASVLPGGTSHMLPGLVRFNGGLSGSVTARSGRFLALAFSGFRMVQGSTTDLQSHCPGGNQCYGAVTFPVRCLPDEMNPSSGHP